MQVRSASASQIGLKDKSVDIATCIAMSHHLTDAQLSSAVREFARVCRSKLIFLMQSGRRCPR
jgi:ubiquinone/menaquinone biosynthesis C-methylase UbiE